MIDRRLNMRIIVRHDTEENWTNLDPLLREGEIVTAVNSHSIGYKIGDGIHRYVDLTFVDAQYAFDHGYVYSSRDQTSFTVKIDTGNNKDEHAGSSEKLEKQLEAILCGVS